MTETELNDIVTALNSGLVPRSGIENIMVGREDIIDQIDKDLNNVKKGLSLTKFIIGKYGTGKSFMQAIITQKGYEKKFVVSKVDFSPYRRLYNNDGMGRATYTEIIKNMSTKTSNCNTIENIIELWISNQISLFASEPDFDLTNQEYINKIVINIKKEIKDIDTCFGGTDFSDVLIIYLKSYISGDMETQRNCIKWISGEYPNVSLAKRDLGVSVIINDQNYYEFLKVICRFVVLSGYAGFIINFDEVVNLYKISIKTIRDKNYEMILRIFNDTIQGDIHNLFITFSGTPQFLEDEFKGLFSYGALKRRLSTNKYEDNSVYDYSQPVIKLRSLKNEEIFILLKKLVNIHELYYKYTSIVRDDDILNFIKEQYNNLENSKITVGEVIRDFFGLLNILQKNSQLSFSDVINSNKKESNIDNSENELENIFNRFEGI
jgi:hypothetical protein